MARFFKGKDFESRTIRQGRWDILRGNEPFKDERRGINLGCLQQHNTDKLGITLNLKTEKGKQLLTKLIKNPMQ